MKSALSGIALLLFHTAIAARLAADSLRIISAGASWRSPSGRLTLPMRGCKKILTVSRAHAHLFRPL